jgi:predicted dehydrogenase
MGESMQPRIEIRWGWESEEDMHSMEEAFASVGVKAQGKPRPPAGNGVGFLLPISVYDVALAAFITGFAAAAGKDAWKAVKRITGRLKEWFDEHYPSPPPHDRLTLILRHPDSEVIVYIASDMRDEAFEALLELELEPRTEYVWDEDKKEWEALS